MPFHFYTLACHCHGCSGHCLDVWLQPVGAQLKDTNPLAMGCARYGVAVGATVTPAFFMSLPNLASTLIIVPIMTLADRAVGRDLFQALAEL